MHKFYRPALLALAAAALSACAAGGSPDASLARDTAAALGVLPDAVAITGRRDVFPSTYYTAVVAGRAHDCQVLTVGFVRTPICTAAGGGLAEVPSPRPRPRRG